MTPHLHVVFMDGGWVRDRVGFKFVPAINFNSVAMFSVIHGILRRLDGLFKEFNYVREDGEGEEPEPAEDVPLPFKPMEPKAYRRRWRTPGHPLYKQTRLNRAVVAELQEPLDLAIDDAFNTCISSHPTASLIHIWQEMNNQQERN